MNGTRVGSETHPCLIFLRHLDPSPEATFHFQTHTDVPKGGRKPTPDPLLKQFRDLTLADVAKLIPELEALNKKGAGVFVARNQCTGPRNAKNVTRIRGIHADLDGVKPEQLQAITERLKPSIVVRTSSQDRLQLYWQTLPGDDLDGDETKSINQELVTLGADPAAVDRPRLFRAVGFNHMKRRDLGDTPMVEMVAVGEFYSAEAIRRAFPISPKSSKAELGNKQPVVKTTTAISVLARAVAALVKERYPELWNGDYSQANTANGQRGYESHSHADLALAGHIVRECRLQNTPEQQIGEVVEEVFSASPAGRRDKWQLRTDYRQSTISRAMTRDTVIRHGNANPPIAFTSHGDLRNTAAFVDLSRGRYLYLVGRGQWMYWADGRWNLCQKNEQLQQAKWVCAQMLDAATKAFAQSPAEAKPMVQAAMQAHTLNRIKAMLTLAASEPGIAVTETELDANPELLGVQNGVINLRTGELLPNRPELKVTRCCTAKGITDPTCPTWMRFLFDIFQFDEATIDAIQLLLGCTLVGHSGEEKLIICYGHGSNGKSVFSNVVHHILGGYAVTAPPSLLTARRQDDGSPRNDIASLAGARYVGINEMQAGDRLDEQVVKMLAGREPITARFLHQEFFTFMPTFTPWLRTNHKPIITGEDDGIWRRLILVPFSRRFAEHEQDPHLEEKLLAERDDILMWMVEGAQRYLRDGLKLSPRMSSEIRSYRKDSDLIGEFLSDKTTAEPDSRINQTTLYTVYRNWCFESGLRPLSKKSFTLRLAERGFRDSKSGLNRFYNGLKFGVADTDTAADGLDGIDSNLALSS